jgi:alpha-tubulin suppressor-like RCC1 family protein
VRAHRCAELTWGGPRANIFGQMKGNRHPRAVLNGAWLLALIVAACGGDDAKSGAAAGGSATQAGAGGSLSASGGSSAGNGAASGGSHSGATGVVGGASNGGNDAGEAGDTVGGTTSANGGKSGSGGTSGGSGPVIPTCLKSVGLGDVYLCVVDSDGAVACRGKNESGQLGIGSSPSSSDTFRGVSGFDAPVSSIWTGYGENYAVTDTGKVFRWGYVDFLTKDEVVPKPVDFSVQLPGAVKVLSGASHRCALNADQSLVCWGANNFNQLSDGSSGHVEPMAIPGLAAILDIAVGYEHSCAVKADHTLWCWGDNRLGQLGIATTDEVKVPTQVAALGKKVVQVATRHDYSCALTDDGKISCWGREGYDDNEGNPTPSLVGAVGDDVSAIALGDWHICALKKTGQVWCWAQDITSTGKSPAIASKTPAPMPGLESDVTNIWAGYFSTCARRKDGSVWCWGSDLGLSTTPKQLAAGCN